MAHTASRGAARRAEVLMLFGLSALADGLVLGDTWGRSELLRQTSAKDAVNQSGEAPRSADVAANSSARGERLPGLGSPVAYKDSPGSHPQPQEGIPSMPPIFMLCVSMYGFIGILWAAFYSLPEEHATRCHSKILLLCMTWTAMSIGMQVLNKTLVMTLKAPALISVGQMWIAVLLVGITNYGKLRNAPGTELKYWLVVPLFFAAMLTTSFYTYEYISLSFYAVLSNLSPFVVLPIECLTMPVDKRPRISPLVVLSIVVMLVGALAYGGGVGNVYSIGVVFALVNMLLAVVDRIIQRRLLTTECKGLSSSVCTVMNNTFGSIPALMLAGFTHQVADIPEHVAAWTDPHIIILFILSGTVGIGICYMGFECQRAISATSFVVMQNASKVIVVICGTVFFQDPIKSPLAVFGLLLSIGGSFSYGSAQMMLQKEAAQEAARKACGGPAAAPKVA